MSKRLLIVVLAALWLPGASRAKCEDSNRFDRYYKQYVTIVNKSKLPPERLAEALYAKAALFGGNDLLLQAANLSPKDPVYFFRWGLRNIPHFFNPPQSDDMDQDERKAYDQRMRKARTALEKALAIDPHYLPALYVYAVTKPTLEQRMQALEAVAKVDSENGEAYYIMAILRFRDAVTIDMTPTPESGYNAYDIPDNKWSEVIELLRKGNARPVTCNRMARLPSVRDIRFGSRGGAYPEVARRNLAEMFLDEPILTPFPGIPGTSNAIVRQMARQTAWEAIKANRCGDRAGALDMLDVNKTFADKLGASEPHRLDKWGVMDAIKALLWHAETQVLQLPPDRTRLARLNKERQLRREVLRTTARDIFKESWVVVPFVKISPTESLTYPDYEAESAGVERMLKELGLAK